MPTGAFFVETSSVGTSSVEASFGPTSSGAASADVPIRTSGDMSDARDVTDG